MAQTLLRGQRLAVAYLDLDGFKAINDQHGHAAGDLLLIAVASRMKQALREGDTWRGSAAMSSSRCCST
jgi:diguanylate cyclase (GGDEF)-like protein